MLTLTVKGNRFATALAAADRNIPAAFVCEVGNETVVNVGDQHLAKVAAWFAEPATLIPGFGYPDGACLIYSAHPEE